MVNLYYEQKFIILHINTILTSFIFKQFYRMFTNTWFSQNKHYDIQPPQLYTQAGLVLRQGYIPEKQRANPTQNSHLKQCISWRLGDWKLHPIQCIITPLVDKRTWRVHTYCIYSIHTFLYNIFIYLSYNKIVIDSHP